MENLNQQINFFSFIRKMINVKDRKFTRNGYQMKINV
jgi:hypothetical protein